MTDPIYRGSIKKGTEPNTIVGAITDAWGWSVFLKGTRQDDGSYLIEGTLGEVPDALKLPLLDDEK